MTSVNVDDKTVMIELGLHGSRTNTDIVSNDDGEVSSSDLTSMQKFVEQQTGFATVVKGVGQLASAVAELRRPASSERSASDIFGVVRLSQLRGNSCFVDGLIDGLVNGLSSKKDHQNSYSLAVHEYGDLSGSFYENIGPVHIPLSTDNQTPNDSGRLSFQRVVPNCHVPSMIGRSIGLKSRGLEKNSKKGILCAGVIARASIVEANQKQICSCSGKTIWDERRERL